MMDIPHTEPFSPDGMAIMNAGKDLEDRITAMLDYAGTLISAPPTAPVQSGFACPETMLTGSIDAVLKLHTENSPHPVEIKSKDDKKIWEMRKGERECEEQHRNQLYAYMYGLKNYPEQIIPNHLDLDPVKGGTVLYVSRDRPMNVHEFYFPYDEEAIELAVSNLKSFGQHWEDGTLPPRPKEWRWTEDPCKWCELKKLCKADMKAGITKLDESNVLKFAEEHDPSYSLEEKRKKVKERWKKS